MKACERNVRGAAVWLLIAATLIPMGCGGGSLSGEEQVSFVTVETDPDWSPDGRLIAFASSRNAGGIYVIRPDGTGLRRVFRGGASNVDWSPDGRRIAFQDLDATGDDLRKLTFRGSTRDDPGWRRDLAPVP